MKEIRKRSIRGSHEEPIPFLLAILRREAGLEFEESVDGLAENVHLREQIHAMAIIMAAAGGQDQIVLRVGSNGPERLLRKDMCRRMADELIRNEAITLPTVAIPSLFLSNFVKELFDLHVMRIPAGFLRRPFLGLAL